MQQAKLTFSKTGISKSSSPSVCSPKIVKKTEFDSDDGDDYGDEHVILTHSDSEIQAFYNSLTAKETIAHKIAIDLLGTSYDPRRTHGFIKWKRSQTVVN